MRAELPLVPLDPAAPAKPPSAGVYADASGQHDLALGEVGVISGVTQAFCHDCNRAPVHRGQAVPVPVCQQGYDLRSLLRGGASDADIAAAIAPIWQQRNDRYSELRSTLPADNTQVRAAWR